MTLKIKNTLSKKKEIFIPIEKTRVRFYQCGATVYSSQHIGNMRAFVLGDFIHRSLKYLGYQVNFVRNYTDVGHLTSDNDGGSDKMEKGVKKENLTPMKISEKYISQIEKDSKKLNILNPTSKPRATKYISQQIAMIKTLLEKDFAYTTPLAIYFDTTKAIDYHRLSGQNLEENLCGAGTGKILDSDKKNPSDFALWFFKAGTHKNALQFWDSPFTNSLVGNGQGFPGWHIECSAMAKNLLGDTLDLKMGGVEHISIHHTNEIAQSENANEKKYVNYWLHNEHLNFNGRKMSKSTGTSILISDLEEKGFSALDLRYFFLQSHYRSKQNFTWESLEASKTAKEKLHKKVLSFSDNGEVSEIFKKEFKEKIEDDFSTPEAIAIVYKVLKSNISNKDKRATILDFDKILGLDLGKKIPTNTSDKISPKNSSEISALLSSRKIAREEKNWEESDKIRDKLFSLGYNISDVNGEQFLKKILKK